MIRRRSGLMRRGRHKPFRRDKNGQIEAQVMRVECCGASCISTPWKMIAMVVTGADYIGRGPVPGWRGTGPSKRGGVVARAPFSDVLTIYKGGLDGDAQEAAASSNASPAP